MDRASATDEERDGSGAAPSRYRAVPFARADLVELILEDFGFDTETAVAFRAFCELLQSLFHFEFHRKLETMKAAYAPFDPDRVAPPGERERSSEELNEAADQLGDTLTDVLERANYVALGPSEIELAMEESSLIPLAIEVDFEAYDELVLFARGESVKEAQVPAMFGLRRRTIRVPTYDRVCLYARFKESVESKGSHQPDELSGAAMLKLFRNIPIADLELLFPNCRVRMRRVDKLLLGVPALVGGVPVAVKLVPAVIALAAILGITHERPVQSASIIAGLSGLVVLGAYLFRQWDKFKNRKVLFMKVLAENLYFRNLDNNEGVLTRLIDEAEEEETKEAILAYAFLLRAERPLEAPELDEQIEAWFDEQFGISFDFEIVDALEKLVRLGLVSHPADTTYAALPLAGALDRLDVLWDGFFTYRGQGPTIEPAGET